MRWSTYHSTRDDSDHVGLVIDGVLHGLPGPDRLIDLLGDNGARLAAAANQARRAPWEVVGIEDVRLRAPVPVPPSVRDFIAFEQHVVTASKAFGGVVDPVWYEVPLFYFSNPAAVRGPHDAVAIAPGSGAFDYEVEIAAVIGAPGRDLHPDTAEQHIAGYLILCDWSARDLQGSEMRGGLGPTKGKDTATSLGPWLITPDELAPRRKGLAYDLDMTASVNGAQWSKGNMSTIYWNFGQLLAYASRGTELRPGDIIGSGTVGSGCILELNASDAGDSYRWLQAGDEVRIEITDLGAIKARIDAGVEAVPYNSTR